jgi:ADP-ribose pyrophosphatase YjhB (NUDIX family)
MVEPLFNPKPDKVIEVYDLFDNKHKRNLKNFKFRVSVYGVLEKGNKILVQRHPKLETYGLPGGGVEIGETINNSLTREFKEETGLTVKVEKLITVTEDFFTYEGEDAHSILITY